MIDLLDFGQPQRAASTTTPSNTAWEGRGAGRDRRMIRAIYSIVSLNEIRDSDE